MSKIYLILNNNNYEFIMSDIISTFYQMCKNDTKLLISDKKNIMYTINKNLDFYLFKIKYHIENNEEFVRPYSQRIEILKYINNKIAGDFCVKNKFFNLIYQLIELMIEGLPLPDVIFFGGDIYEGPDDFSETIKMYGSDSLRYYLARSISYGNNFYFNKDALIGSNNYILINFENLVNKCYKVCVNICHPNDPFIPPYNSDELENPIDMEKFITEFTDYFTKFEIREAIIILERAVEDSIAYIDYILMMEKYTKDQKYLEKYINKYLNLVYIFSHYYSLICPNLANYVVNKVLLTNFVSFDKLHLSILPHNKKLLKTDKISFITKLQ